jgi:serine/threonine-protein kinase ULK/ATG1
MGELREAGHWVLQREIGSGSFAKVWQATHKQTQQVAAVKEINLEKLSKKLQESLASEVAVLKHTQHHNIVCLLDLIKVWPPVCVMALCMDAPYHEASV